MVLPMNEALPPSAPSRGPAEHDVRDQIIEAADKHFSRYGYEKTTVSDLAKAIGFSKAYIYKFFDSKQAIGEAICSKTVNQILVEPYANPLLLQHNLDSVEAAPAQLSSLVLRSLAP